MSIQGDFLQLALRPTGMLMSDMPQCSKQQLYKAAQVLCEMGKCHRLQVGGQHFRYFGKLEDRERFALQQPTRQPKKPAAHQKPQFTNQPKAPSGGPARLEGPLVITPKTKFTFGVSPSNPTHTTTHAE